MSKKIQLFILISFGIFLSSCVSDSADNESSVNISETSDSDPQSNKARKIFYSIPSPIEMAALLKKAGAGYNVNHLNPIENLSKYSTSASQALNLGVYGTDMSFASIFNQTQETMLFLKCVNNLARNLGISDAFDEGTIARMETNSSNHDSILQIISEAYWNADASLKEDNRKNISAFIIAGGWIEGLFVATRIAQETQNQEVINRIGEQKLSLKNLISIIESYPSDEDTKSLLVEFKSLQQVFEKVVFSKSDVQVTTDPKNKITTISGTGGVSINKETLKEITEKIEIVRNNIIK